jgi:5-methylcytosine-specific restriction endonuclease McrA
MTLPKKLPRKTSPGLGLSLVDRAVNEFFADRRGEDLQTAMKYFTNAGAPHCFYCGKLNPNRWDHFHPVTKGGDTVVGNLVPACQQCDDSKQDRSLEGMGKQPFKI